MPGDGKKPLSMAIQELQSGQVKIVSEEDENPEITDMEPEATAEEAEVFPDADDSEKEIAEEEDAE